jgi:hypothetical protein
MLDQFLVIVLTRRRGYQNEPFVPFQVAQNPLRFLIRQDKDSPIITILFEVVVVDEYDATIV